MFLLFKPFNLVKGFVIDWMHSVCLGVTKSLINLWLNAENRAWKGILLRVKGKIK